VAHGYGFNKPLGWLRPPHVSDEVVAVASHPLLQKWGGWLPHIFYFVLFFKKKI
jgi:hypothetical protein